jgi:hypothetical protein
MQPPPLPSPAKSGPSAGKVILIVFAAFVGLVLLAFAGIKFIGGTGEANGPASFSPSDIEARCSAAGLQYYAGASSGRLWDRANEQQQERLKAMGIKLYRIKIRKKYDVVYILSVIEAPSDFSSSQAKEVLEVIAPPTPVAISGRYIYCYAGRPDPKGSTGDDVIWMTPQELYESLGR